MSFDSDLIDQYDCRPIVIVRWNQSVTTSTVPSAGSIVSFIETVGYSLGRKDKIGYSPTPSVAEQFIVLPMRSVKEAARICDDSVNKGFGVNDTRITINRMIEINGIRLRDGRDFVGSGQGQFDNNEMLHLLMITNRLELPERMKVARTGFELIKKGISELIENACCEMFGSFGSSVRRTAYSDIDINIESFEPSERKGSSQLRSINDLLTHAKTLSNSPLTNAELYTYSPEDIIKVLFRCFNENNIFKQNFEISYVPARTPIMIFKTKDEMGANISFDVSIRNQKGVDKASLLDEFIMKDTSMDNKMREAMLFIVHWARTNKLLPGAFPEEKLEKKTNLNSYIFNHLVIHFVQATANKYLVQPLAKVGSRVEEYNFDHLFKSHAKFLREFFKYYASFDFTNKAVYGRLSMNKETLTKVHNARESPLMVMDPIEPSHNISAKVTEDALKLLNGLIRNTLFILKQKDYCIIHLLDTNRTAASMMKNKESKITMATDIVDGVEKHILTLHLPDIIRNAEDLLLLFTRILRFDLSPDHEGPSVTTLKCTGGVVFAIQARTWIGRRNKKRQLKSLRNDLSPLELDVMCSEMYQYEDEPIALVRVVMPEISSTPSLRAYIQIIRGSHTEVRDAMHYLIDQFVLNNLEVLVEKGVQCIAKIPIAGHVSP